MENKYKNLLTEWINKEIETPGTNNCFVFAKQSVDEGIASFTDYVPEAVKYLPPSCRVRLCSNQSQFEYDVDKGLHFCLRQSHWEYRKYDFDTNARHGWYRKSN